MKIISYTVEKIILTTAEEKSIKASWGVKWKGMKYAQEKHGFFYLVMGEWGGYTISQTKIVHTDIATQYMHQTEVLNKRTDNNGFLGTIIYTDETTLDVNIRKCTLEQLLTEKIYKKDSYTELIKKLIESKSQIYKVK
jgi:hypothetical protein